MKIMGGTNGGAVIGHKSFISEQMADEQADVYMLNLANEHPEYFNKDLISQKLEQYNQGKTIISDYYTDPRNMFDMYLEDIRTAYRNRNESHTVKPILQEVEQIKKKQEPLIEKLKSQRISECLGDSYYNIYLNSLYKYEERTFSFNNNSHTKGASK